MGSQEDWSEVGLTIRWAAPELLEGNIRSKKSDVYSFAMLMIEVYISDLPCVELLFTVISYQRRHSPEQYRSVKDQSLVL